MLERTEWLDHIVDARPVKSDEMDAASQSYAIGARDDFAYYRLLAIACLPASSCDAQASRDTDPREEEDGDNDPKSMTSVFAVINNAKRRRRKPQPVDAALQQIL
jgi:hypothetical protein